MKVLRVRDSTIYLLQDPMIGVESKGWHYILVAGSNDWC